MTGNTITDYPVAAYPLPGNAAFPVWQGGGQRYVSLNAIAASLAGLPTSWPDDAAGSAASAATSASNALAAAAIASNAANQTVATSLLSVVGIFGNAYAASLPKCLSAITIGGTAISGATPGSYPLTASGGSLTGVVATLIVDTATTAHIVITNAGIGTGTTPPTFAKPAGATLPAGTTLTGVVSVLIPDQRTYWAASSDGTQMSLFGNNGGVLASAPFGGTQLSTYMKAGIDSAVSQAVNSVPFVSWAALSAATGMLAGNRATVAAADAGTHTDPVVGGTVLNAGVYQYFTAPAGWKRIADLDSQTAGTAVAGVGASATDAVQRADVAVANIFDNTRITLNTAIRMSDGAPVANTGKVASDFIRIAGGTSLATLGALFGDGTYGLAFYTAAATGNFIAASGVNGLAAGGSAAAPATANFVRVTFQTAAIAAAAHLVRGATAPTVYRAFDTVDSFTAYGSFLSKLGKRFVQTSPNLYNKATVTNGQLVGSAGSLSVGASWSTTDFMPIEGGKQYVPNIKANSGATGIVWFAADQTTVVGTNLNHTEFTAYTAPVNAAFARVGFANSGYLGILGDNRFSFVQAAAATDLTSYGFATPGSAATRAHKAVRNQTTSQNLYRKKDLQKNVLIGSTTGVAAYSSTFSSTGKIEVYPGQQIYFSKDCQAASAATAIRFVDRDDNAIGAAVASGAVISTDTSTPNQITLTTLGNTMLVPGTPISATGVPVGSYITSAPAGYGLGVYGISSAVTATAAGVTLGGGGYLQDVPITVPPEAHYMYAPVASGCETVLRITDSPRVAATVLASWDEVQSGRPWMGRPYASFGDSIWAGGPIGGASAAAPYGNHQTAIEQLLRANLVFPYAANGRKMRDALLSSGGFYIPTTPDLVTSDFDSTGKTITADTTNGSKVINVSAISPSGTRWIPGSIVTGPGIPSNTRVESYPNGGTGSTGSVTLTNPCTATATGVNLTFVSPFSEGGLATFAFGRNDFTSATVFSAGITTVNGSNQITVNSTTTEFDIGAYPVGTGLPAGVYVSARGTGTGGTSTGTYTLSAPATASGTITATGTMYGNARPLGVLGDTSAAGTFYGDMHGVIMEQLLTWQPKLRIAMFTTIPSFDNNDFTSIWAGNPINKLGLRMTDYDAAIKNFCAAHGLDCFDMRQASGLNKKTATGWMLSDLVHPLLIYNVERFTSTIAKFLNGLQM